MRKEERTYCRPGTAQKRKKRISLHFLRSQLLYDIANCGYVESDTMRTDSPHESHQPADICQEGNVDRVTRVLDLAFEECADALYPYSKREVACGTELDDTLREREAYAMRLLVPEDFSETTAGYLSALIHEYMVCRVLADWLGITKPQSRDAWEAKADGAMERLRESLNMRTTRVRRTSSPF